MSARHSVGQLVVLDGEVGVWRVERVLDDGRVRAFSYASGAIVVVDALAVRPCPDNELAQTPPRTEAT